jgi:hypothetical protein
MDIRSKFRTLLIQQWKDASKRSIPHRWLLRATGRLGQLKDWRKGRPGGRDPFGVIELGQMGAEKISSAYVLASRTANRHR